MPFGFGSSPSRPISHLRALKAIASHQKRRDAYLDLASTAVTPEEQTQYLADALWHEAQILELQRTLTYAPVTHP